MEKPKLYHTVENRNNEDYVIKNAPFKCTRRDAWLGEGYYFWDTSISLAHWWGQKSCKNNYFIFETSCSYEIDSFLDLVGNVEQIEEIRECTLELIKKYKKKVTVPFVIKYLKKNTSFKYKMIRANGEKSKRNDPNTCIPFKENNKAYIDLDPTIQICIIDRNIINFPLTIVYKTSKN